MNLKNCRDCGRVFAYTGSLLCSNCLDKLDQAFYKVREYLYKYPNANIDKISEETEVPRKTILQMLKEGRLELKAEASGLTCRTCKAPVSAGLYCPGCLHETERRFKGAVTASTAEEQQNQKTGLKYHTDTKKVGREG